MRLKQQQSSCLGICQNKTRTNAKRDHELCAPLLQSHADSNWLAKMNNLGTLRSSIGGHACTTARQTLNLYLDMTLMLYSWKAHFTLLLQCYSLFVALVTNLPEQPTRIRFTSSKDRSKQKQINHSEYHHLFSSIPRRESSKFLFHSLVTVETVEYLQT